MLIKGTFCRIFNYARKKYIAFKRNCRIRKFISSGRKPWSVGYEDYKWDYIYTVINDFRLLEVFHLHQELPIGFGKGLDERVVEYPWVISRLANKKVKLLDAGSAFNYPMIIQHPKIHIKDLTIFALTPERNCFSQKKISYYFGDLRDIPFRAEWFDEISCISTIEHIGMDNRMYDSNLTIERCVFDFVTAAKELKRILRVGGKMFITIPFGKRQEILWGDTVFMQQFNGELLARLKKTLSGCEVITHFYQYFEYGWNISTEKSCSDVEYFNIHVSKSFDEDFAAASRAIVCLEITKK